VRFVYLSFFSFWTLRCFYFFDLSYLITSFHKENHLKLRYFNSGCHGRWIFNYLCNQCLSPLTLNPTHERCNRYKIMGTAVASTNKTDRHDITEILLKVALSTINQTNISIFHLAVIYFAYIYLLQCSLIKTIWIRCILFIKTTPNATCNL
jgi:hypothetical protein